MEQQSERQDTLRQQILQVAGEMFLNHGYNDTTFQKIADELGIAKSTITYHYKNKFWIMAEVINDFFDFLRRYVRSFREENIFKDSYWFYCVIYIYAYRRIMSTPRTMELFYHDKQQEQWQNHEVESVVLIYQRIFRDFHRSYDIEDLRMRVHMDMGARSQLYHHYQKSNTMTLDEYCYYHIYLLGVLCQIDEVTIQEHIEGAFEFANTHEPPAHWIFG